MCLQSQKRTVPFPAGKQHMNEYTMISARQYQTFTLKMLYFGLMIVLSSQVMS